MRELTEEELAKCPSNCDYYHIINGEVYFTNVLGVGVYDIKGNEVDDSLLDGIFKISKPIEKPFDITKHEWSDGVLINERLHGKSEELNLFCNYVDGEFSLDKKDAIAIANHFSLTAEDLK